MLSALLFTHFMVRVLIHPTLMPFICSSRISTFFSPLHCSQHAAPISLSTHPVCYAFCTGLAGRLCSSFFLFSVLYFADKASKLITFLSPSFFLLFIFLRISWGCLFTERSSLKPFCLYFSIQTQILSQLLTLPSPSLSIVPCSRSIALLLIDPDV